MLSRYELSFSIRRSISDAKFRFACLPVCGSKHPVSQRVLSHLRIALCPGGSIFHVRRTWRCTRVTDFSSASHNTHWTFCCGVQIFPICGSEEEDPLGLFSGDFFQISERFYIKSCTKICQ
ncbi:hypothetical protein C0J52_20518 [Blattella germanica]|nr:hypothetical protein C0J52_20518 [Blattella germanica]